MKRYILPLGLIFFGYTISASAGTLWDDAVIEKISSNTYGEVKISLDKTSASVCRNKQKLLIPIEEGHLSPLFSRALFAYSTGDRIDIYGTGKCRGEYEIVQFIGAKIN